MKAKAVPDNASVLALDFFCLSLQEKLTHLETIDQKTIPDFFGSYGRDVLEANYLFGVACVFVTYSHQIFGRFLCAEDDAVAIGKFSDRLRLAMYNFSSSSWSAKSMSSPMWEELRVLGLNALAEIGEPLVSSLEPFDVLALVDPNEFRTTDEVRLLLDGI